MNKFVCSFIAVVIMLAGAIPAMAQQKRLSPHETISTVVDGNRVMIVYGRPYTKNPRTGEVRKIWGGLIPFGQVWRTGADEATLLITQKPIVMGDVTVSAGAYTLWTLPAEDGSAKLIINKQIGQWGVDPHEPSNAYDEKQDLGRVDLKKADLDKPVDQFTMAIKKNPDGGGLIKLSWENIEYSIAYTVQK
jgi:hypothetical protein